MSSRPRRRPLPVTAPAEEQPGSHLPPRPGRHGRLTEPPSDHQVKGPDNALVPAAIEIARQREEDRRRAARRYGPAGLAATAL